MRKLSQGDVGKARALREEAMALQSIEDNPLDDEDIAMFEMFEREAWSHEQRRAYILERAASSSRSVA